MKTLSALDVLTRLLECLIRRTVESVDIRIYINRKINTDTMILSVHPRLEQARHYEVEIFVYPALMSHCSQSAPIIFVLQLSSP